MEARELMESAWEIRRRFLSAPADEQPGLIDEAHGKLTDAVAICREANSKADLGQAIHLLANVELDRGNEDRAEALWQEAVAIFRDTGDQLQLAHKVRHLGDLHRRHRRLDRAEACYDEALTLYRKHDDAPPLDFANAVSRMASLKKDAGLWREARDLYEAAGLPQGVEQCEKQIARLQ